MKEYEDMEYYALKSECAKMGINKKGTKEVLLKRIKETKFPTPIEETETKAPKPEGVIKETETPDGDGVVLASPHLPQSTVTIKSTENQRFDPWLNPSRLEKLSNELSAIAANKGKFRFDINHEKREFQVEFSGKLQGLISTTLIDTDKRIIKEATHYFNSRYVKGKNAQQTVFKK